jgi:hypothetical protein
VTGNPAWTGEDPLSTIGHQFQQDYGVVLRAVLNKLDELTERHRSQPDSGQA